MKRLGEIFGALTLVGGLTWLLINLSGPHPLLDVAVGAVLTAGGLVLLMPHRARLPGRLTAAWAALVALGGTAAGLLAQEQYLGGAFLYAQRRGLPFRWLARGGLADDPVTARRLAESASWQVDAISLAADLLVFAYAGMLLVAVVVLVRRTAAERAGRRATGAVKESVAGIP